MEQHPAIWQQTARDLLYKIISHIAIEEGIKTFCSREDEEKLKEHLPYAISNAIEELSRATLGLSNTSIDTMAQTTILFLFFKIVEWFGQNYNNICIYGEKPDDAGLRLYRTCRNKTDILAEKDEIWIEMDAICQEYGHKGLLENSIYGCKIYSAQAKANIPYNIFLNNIIHSHDHQTRQIIETNIILTAITKTTDVTSIGIHCDPQEKNTKTHEICAVLEKNIVRLLREKCEGTS